MNNSIKLITVPDDVWEQMVSKVNAMHEILLNKKENTKGSVGEYISEKEAKTLLSRGTTWFWNKRQSGELVGKKAGGTWYYKRSEIINYIENGKSE